MERMEHVFGKVLLDGEVLFDKVEGYICAHQKKNGVAHFGHIILSDDQATKVNPTTSYVLQLNDRRTGNIYLDLHPGEKPGTKIAEFHVTGKFDKK